MISPTVKRRIKKVLLWTEVLVILILGAGMGVVLGAFYQINKQLPPGSALDQYRAPVPTKIWSSDGQLLAKLAAENREPIPLERIPKVMQDAIIAIEDARFYRHPGLDLQSIARAVWVNATRGELDQGFSTITQQLARNMYLSSRKTISRKIKEVLLAVQIERNWTKKQILEAYLNQVYFGSGAYGVQTAAQVYFGKGAKELKLEEAAMLAGLVQRPSELSPHAVHRRDGNYEATRRRRNLVLDRMAELGMISRQEAERAKATPIRVLPERRRATGFLKAQYFAQYVTDYLRDQLNYDEDVLNKAGLQVVTTLDWDMQKAAEEAARTELAKIRRSHRVTEAALVCLDPHTGYIRAMVGGVNEPWEKYQFNCATQAHRQPGSAFKLFVYTAAFESGDTPSSRTPASAIPITMPDGKVYRPKNHSRRAGIVDYRTAFALSLNGAAVNVAVKHGVFAGPRKVKEIAQRLGIRSELRAYPSIALGASEVTVLEMASAYGVFAAGGKRAEPLPILQIRSQDGRVLEDFQPRLVDTGLSPQTIQYINELTRAVVTSGTGRGARAVPEARGKTGTSEDYTDAWFIGYTPDLVTAVWAGNRDNSRMARVYGGTIGVPIWTKFMLRAIELNPAKKQKPQVRESRAEPQRTRRREPRRPQPITAPVPADGNDRNRVRVTICPDSGLRATDDCPSRVTQEYLLGDEPLARCDLHGPAAKKAPAKRAPAEPNAPATPRSPEETRPPAAAPRPDDLRAPADGALRAPGAPGLEEPPIRIGPPRGAPMRGRLPGDGEPAPRAEEWAPPREEFRRFRRRFHQEAARMREEALRWLQRERLPPEQLGADPFFTGRLRRNRIGDGPGAVLE